MPVQISALEHDSFCCVISSLELMTKIFLLELGDSMKLKTIGLGVLTLAAVTTLAACGNSTSASKDASKKIETSVDKKTTITFWHAMTGAQEKALQKLTTDFEKANPKITVKLQSQSSYPDLQAKLTSTMQSPKNLPTITQAYPGWLLDASKNNLLVDLKPYLSNSKIGISGSEAIKPELLKGAQFSGVQYGIPFNKSTEVLFYNADLLKKYDLKVPTTMTELKDESKTIYEKSNHQVVGAGFDALNNYYSTALKDAGENFTSKTDFTGQTSKDAIDYYFQGVKAGYFRIAGSDKYMDGPFDNQKVAFYIGSSAGESFVAQDAKFNYGVAARPSKYAISQGTDIYMFSQASQDQRTAAYLYEKFLAKTSSTVYFANQTGYIPVTEAGMKDAAYVDNKTSKVPAIISDATKNLFTTPLETNSDAAYTQLTATMQAILSNPKGNEDDLIKQGAAQLKNAWNQ